MIRVADRYVLDKLTISRALGRSTLRRWGGLTRKESDHPTLPTSRLLASDRSSSGSFALMLSSQRLHLHNGPSSNATVRVTLRFHRLRSPRRS